MVGCKKVGGDERGGEGCFGEFAGPVENRVLFPLPSGTVSCR